jgi:hypothetical protein
MFPLYDGPLSTHALMSHCFACGKKSLMVLGTEDGTSGLGICKKHLPLVERIVPKENFEEAGKVPEIDLDSFRDRLTKA